MIACLKTSEGHVLKKMNHFLELSRLHKQFIAAAADFIFLPLTFYLAIWLRYDVVGIHLIEKYKWLLLAAPAISIPIFIRIGLYRAVVRFIDHDIVYVVAGGVSLAVGLMAALATFLHMTDYSRGVFGIYWLGAISYVALSRFLARGYLLRASGTRGATGATRVVIYGAGSAGTQLASALVTGKEYHLLGFVDDKAELHGATIGGLVVYPPEKLADLVAKKQIKEILLAMPSLSPSEQRRILDRLEPLKVKTKVTPPIKSLISGEIRLQDVREIGIEDLLGREPVAPDCRLLSACISGKAVLVTGAGGSIGSELCRQILALRPTHLLLLEISEFALYSIEQELRAVLRQLNLNVEVIPFLGSVLDTERCLRILRTFSVHTVYHAAAYKHVPLVEFNPIEGIRNNVFGTLSIASAAKMAGVKSFVLISTDKAVRPTNVMGATKRLGELILQAFATENISPHVYPKFCLVRFGNVLGSSGSVVPLFQKQIKDGGPVTITHTEITRYFMTIPEAAQLVLQAGAMGEGGDVFVLDMGEPVKIIDLATRMIHLSGLEVKSEDNPDGEVEIKAVGLRPGEKLYEELLIGGDVEGTEHPLIMRARETEIPWPLLEQFLKQLEDACINFDNIKVREILLLAVKEYAPQGGIEDMLWQANVSYDLEKLRVVH
jgi:FlaA1/EpsC-like NDP-sugar epimerase